MRGSRRTGRPHPVAPYRTPPQIPLSSSLLSVRRPYSIFVEHFINLYRVSGIGQTAMEFLRVDSKHHVHDSMRVQLLQLCDAHCRHLDRDGGGASLERGRIVMNQSSLSAPVLTARTRQ